MVTSSTSSNSLSFGSNRNPQQVYQGTGMQLAPREELSAEFKARLTQLNKLKATHQLSFVNYVVKLEELLQIHPYISTPENQAKLDTFMAGIAEGEGSLNVSIKEAPTSRSGFTLTPEFSVTQAANSGLLLCLALRYFGEGSVRYKSGSNATLVFRISRNLSLLNLVIPFYKKHMTAFRSTFINNRLLRFEKLVKAIEENEGSIPGLFVYKILPLWDSLRIQISKKSRFQNLTQAQTAVIENYTRKGVSLAEINQHKPSL